MTTIFIVRMFRTHEDVEPGAYKHSAPRDPERRHSGKFSIGPPTHGEERQC
ncbi:hypothetical protein J7E62_31605 [Variovorax paradoxus]|nr:hypothetical protein [Variovorax paradoxus]